MGRALVGWYQATGQRRILDALVRTYADYPLPLGPLRFDDDVSGLCNLDAMLETYWFSGDVRVKKRLEAAIHQKDIDATVADWIAGRVVPGHAVRAHEALRLPALMYLATGEPRYREASLAAFRWCDQNHLLPHGVTSGQEILSGIGAFRLTETCNVDASLWANVWLYRTLGDSSWGDRIERIFFNAAPAPIARDFQTMCYYQSPNRIQGQSLPSFPNGDSRWLRFSRLGSPEVFCCVGSMNRIIPNYVIHMWMATADRGLAATLYGPATVSALAGDHIGVKLICRTAYPFEETIRVSVEPEHSGAFPLYFRIPAWCDKPRITLNGSPQQSAADRKGFVRMAADLGQGRRRRTYFSDDRPRGSRHGDRVSRLSEGDPGLDGSEGAGRLVPEAAVSLRERVLRSAAVRVGDSRQGPGHAGAGGPLAVCIGRCLAAWRGGHPGRAQRDARSLGLAACRAAGFEGAGPRGRLEADGGAGVARRVRWKAAASRRFAWFPTVARSSAFRCFP